MATDSDGTFGGNGSVEWAVDTVNNPKWQSSTPKAPKGHMHTGAEETPPDAEFTVTLKNPGKYKDRLIETLRSCADALQSGADYAAFNLRILEKTYDQIRVSWPSVPPQDNAR